MTASLSTSTALVVRSDFQWEGPEFCKILMGEARSRAEKAAIEELRANPRVGAFANQHGWTDVDPFEIVRVVSAKCLEVRAMTATRDESWKPEMIPGGFAGHTVNNYEQRWIITPNPAAPVRRIRLQKSGQWKDAGGNRYSLALAPRYFYDYNF